jgi:hypothetical protein
MLNHLSGSIGLTYLPDFQQWTRDSKIVENANELQDEDIDHMTPICTTLQSRNDPTEHTFFTSQYDIHRQSCLALALVSLVGKALQRKML